jgi:hypothetical protein
MTDINLILFMSHTNNKNLPLLNENLNQLQLITEDADDRILSKVGLHNNGKAVSSIMNILKASLKAEANDMSDHMRNCASIL